MRPLQAVYSVVGAITGLATGLLLVVFGDKAVKGLARLSAIVAAVCGRQSAAAPVHACQPNGSAPPAESTTTPSQRAQETESEAEAVSSYASASEDADTTSSAPPSAKPSPAASPAKPTSFPVSTPELVPSPEVAFPATRATGSAHQEPVAALATKPAAAAAVRPGPVTVTAQNGMRPGKKKGSRKAA